MTTSTNRRSYTRYTYEVPVTIETGIHKKNLFSKEDPPSISAALGNYSRGGMYLESLYFLPPGTAIAVTLASPENDPVTGEKKSYHAEVKWCRKIAGGSQTMYGIGLMYDQRITHFVFGFGTTRSSWMMSTNQMADLGMA